MEQVIQTGGGEAGGKADGFAGGSDHNAPIAPGHDVDAFGAIDDSLEGLVGSVAWRHLDRGHLPLFGKNGDRQ